MENKDYSTADSSLGDLNGTPSIAVDAQAATTAGALQAAPLSTPQSGLSVSVNRRLPGSWKLILVSLLFLAGLIIVGFLGYRQYQQGQQSATTETVEPADAFAIQSLSLDDLAQSGDLNLATTQALSVNGQLRTNNSLVLSPTERPTEGSTGQLYYDQTENGLVFYNGTEFVAIAADQDLELLRTQLQGVQSSIPTIPSDVATLGSSNVFRGLNTFNSGVNAASLTVSGGTALQSSLSVAGNATLQGSLNVSGPATLGATTMSSLLLASPLAVSSGGTGSTNLAANGVLIGQGTSPVSSVTAAGSGLCLMSTAGAPAFAACPGGVGSGVNSLNGLMGDLSVANSSAAGAVITIDNASTSTKGIASFNATNFIVTSGAVNTVQDISVTASPTFANLTAATLTGNGSGITNLNASNVSSGTLGDGRLSVNIPLLGAATNNFTGTLQRAGNTVCDNSNNCGYLTGSAADGSYIQLQVGTPGTAQTGHFNITGTGIANALTAVTLAGNGTAVTNVNAAQLNSQAPSYYLNATNISSGTLNDARLSANVALLNASTNNFTGTTLQHGGNDVCDNSNNCNYLTGSAANGIYIQLQASTPGTAQTGHFNITGTGRATALYQNGSQVCDTTGNCAGLGGSLTGSGTTGTIAKFTGSGNLGDSLLTESGGAVTVNGDLFADSFDGDGSAVTNVNAAQLGGQVAGYYLNATNISSGTLSDSRLSANVTIQGNTFNGANQLVQLNASSQLPALSGALLTNLNGSSITSGTVSDSRLSANVALLGASTNNFTGTTLQHGGNDVCDNSNNCNYLTGSAANGAYIQLQGATPGTPQTGNLNITGTAIAGNFSGNGSALSNLNASNLASGSVADVRLSANVALLNAATSNFTGTLQKSGNDVCDNSNNCNYLTGSAANGAYIQLQGTTPGTPQTGNLNISGTAIAANFSGNGSAVTNVNASQLNSQSASYYLNATNVNAGTLADARLSTAVTLQGNTFNGASQLVQTNASSQLPAISGALLTNLNGTSVASGTVADARLSANVALLNAAANFTGTLQQGGSNVCTASGNCTSVTSIGALDGGTANATGATLSSNTLYLQSASATYAGLVNTSSQSFAGVKTFTSGAVISADQSLTLSSSTGNSALLSVGGLNSAALTVDTSASTGSLRVAIGVPGTCNTGRFCVNQGVTASSGAGPFTNSQNILDVNRTAAAAITFTGQRVRINDVTTGGVANTLQGFVVDSRAGTTNSSASINSYMADIASTHGGNFLWLQHNGSTNVFTVSNAGNLATNGTGTFTGNLATSGRLGANNTSPNFSLTVNSVGTGTHNAAAYINTGSSSDMGLIIQGVASQSSNYLTIKTSTGGVVASISSTAGSFYTAGGYTSGNGQFVTEDGVGASSTDLILRSGGSTGGSSTTGDVTIRSGNGTSGASSGDVIIDAGNAAGTAGVVTIAASNASALSLGRSGITTTFAGNTLLNGSNNTVSVNSATALLIQNTSATALLTADTSTMKVTVRTLEVTLNLTVNGHLISGGSTPSIAAGTAACTTPSVSVSGTDTSGRITVTTGTGCGSSGKLATITFSGAFGSAPRVTLTPAGSNAAGLTTYIDDATISTTAFDLSTTTTAANSTTYRWYYHVIQ